MAGSATGAGQIGSNSLFKKRKGTFRRETYAAVAKAVKFILQNEGHVTHTK